jgi:AcrR family transcriptional regulator
LFRETEWTLRFCYRTRVPTPAKTLRSDARRNRERLVASARELFAERGLEVPVEEITQHAGVGMGTLYRHFPTKDDLVEAVLEDAFAEIGRLAEEAAATEDAWEGLTSFLHEALELHVQNRGVKDLLAAREHGHDAARARIRRLLRSVVEGAQEQGTLRRDFAFEDLPPLFWSTARIVQATADVAPGYWRRYLSFVLDGLRASAATRAPAPPLTRAQLQRAHGRHGR